MSQRRKTTPSAPAATTRDRKRAIRLLRTAVELLARESDPFPVLAAARKVNVRVGDAAWELAAWARAAASGPRDESQLLRAIGLLEDPEAYELTSEAPARRLVRVPRCRDRAAGGRCERPIDHAIGCSTDPVDGDAVSGVGTQHVLIARPDGPSIVALERGARGGEVRVYRDDHDRGLWFRTIDSTQKKSKDVLVPWSGLRRLVTDLNLETADRACDRPGAPVPRTRVRDAREVPVSDPARRTERRAGTATSAAQTMRTAREATHGG